MSLSPVVLDRGPLNITYAPSGADIVHAARLGLNLGRGMRASAMNALCGRLLIPAGGFTGQARLFVKGDLRLGGLLALMAHQTAAKAIAFNLARVVRYTDAHVWLALVTAAREQASALTATSNQLIDSWHEGGLDFLWKTRAELGLPSAITSRWEPVPSFVSPETHHAVFPAYIPARDQTVVYAAQISSSYQLSFKARIERELGPRSDDALGGLSRAARLVWQAYAFLAPGGPAVRSGAAAAPATRPRLRDADGARLLAGVGARRDATGRPRKGAHRSGAERHRVDPQRQDTRRRGAVPGRSVRGGARAVARARRLRFALLSAPPG